jgi:hypothetical protein
MCVGHQVALVSQSYQISRLPGHLFLSINVIPSCSGVLAIHQKHAGKVRKCNVICFSEIETLIFKHGYINANAILQGLLNL